MQILILITLCVYMKLNTSTSHKRFNTQLNKDLRELLGTKSQIYKRGTRCTLISLSKALIKTRLGFPLYTKRSRFETLILNGLELLFRLNSNSADTILDRSSLTLDQLSFAILHSKFLRLAPFKL